MPIELTEAGLEFCNWRARIKGPSIIVDLNGGSYCRCISEKSIAGFPYGYEPI